MNVPEQFTKNESLSQTLHMSDIERAAKRLLPVIRQTPLQRSETFSEMTGVDLYLKYENLQKTGSFKLRGAYNKIHELKEENDDIEVVTASAGNHAQGVAYASNMLGVRATIVMPKSTPIAKINATESYGARVILNGNCYDDACSFAQELQRSCGAAFIHPFDDLSVIAGQGTLGEEILQVLPRVDGVLIPAGGGGLLAGTAFAIKQRNPHVRVVGVQAEGAAAIVGSFKQREPIALSNLSTIADGIAVKKPGIITQNIINEYVDEMMTVSDAEISSAILYLMERSKSIVEPAGAASLAAALSGRVNTEGKRWVCLLSGGNIDVGFIHRIIEIGLVVRRRKLRFRTVMPDIPGSLEHFSRIMAESFANIVMVQYDRMSAHLDPLEVILHIACEVGGEEHGAQVIRALENAGYHITIE